MPGYNFPHPGRNSKPQVIQFGSGREEDIAAARVTSDRSGAEIVEWSWTFRGVSPTSWIGTVPDKRVLITNDVVTVDIAVTDQIGDEFSECAWEFPDITFGSGSGVPIKRRVFRER